MRNQFDQESATYQKIAVIVDHPLRIEFGPLKFFSKTFILSIIFYSTLQISGGGHFQKDLEKRIETVGNHVQTVGTF